MSLYFFFALKNFDRKKKYFFFFLDSNWGNFICKIRNFQSIKTQTIQCTTNQPKILSSNFQANSERFRNRYQMNRSWPGTRENEAWIRASRPARSIWKWGEATKEESSTCPPLVYAPSSPLFYLDWLIFWRIASSQNIPLSNFSIQVVFGSI